MIRWLIIGLCLAAVGCAENGTNARTGGSLISRSSSEDASSDASSTDPAIPRFQSACQPVAVTGSNLAGRNDSGHQ